MAIFEGINLFFCIGKHYLHYQELPRSIKQEITSPGLMPNPDPMFNKYLWWESRFHPQDENHWWLLSFQVVHFLHILKSFKTILYLARSFNISGGQDLDYRIFHKNVFG